jgi:hypothetical protein
MPTSEARIEANRRNGMLSRGPTTEAGKAQSRRNALKHGLTAEAIIPDEELAEVDRKFEVMKRELRPSTELAVDLVHRIAVLSVRMRRCEVRENARLTEQVQKAIEEVVPPEGASPEEVAELQADAADVALFDPSPEAERARRYEAAAQRGFYKAINEFRQVEAETIPTPAAPIPQPQPRPLGSFRPANSTTPRTNPEPQPAPPIPAKPAPIARDEPARDAFYVPIAAGKAP